jgi:hypothetical protein
MRVNLKVAETREPNLLWGVEMLPTSTLRIFSFPEPKAGEPTSFTVEVEKRVKGLPSGQTL